MLVRFIGYHTWMHKLSLLKLFFLGSNLEDTLWFITHTASVVKKEKIKRIYAIVIIMQVLEYTFLRVLRNIQCIECHKKYFWIHKIAHNENNDQKKRTVTEWYEIVSRMKFNGVNTYAIKFMEFVIILLAKQQCSFYL